MVRSARYDGFLADKKTFFQTVDSVKAASVRAKKNDYRFIANNRLLIEQEFNQTIASLKKQDSSQKSLWLYCYYCCLMLETYYRAYDKKVQAGQYRQQCEQIKYRCDTGSFPRDEVDEDSFLRLLQKKIAADLDELASTLQHASKIRDWISFTNLYRIHLVFTRLFVGQGLRLTEVLRLIAYLDKVFGTQTDVNGMLAIINAPTTVFNILSVLIFASRLFINFLMILKHTFFPSEEEKLLSTKERFYNELYKRHCDLLNDFVWGTVNGLTNYAFYFNISASVANWMLAGFLLFDVCLLMYRRHLAHREYALKKEQYVSEKQAFAELMSAVDISLENMHKYHEHNRLLDEQLIQLEINSKACNATFLFNVSAAIFLMGGFSASLLFAAPAAIVACYLVCIIAIAMYMSGDIYGKYKEKSLILQQQQLEKKDTALALNDAKGARNDFIMAMVKNTVMPMLIVTTFAICWPAALVLTALYIGYECTKGYFNQPKAELQKAPPTARIAHLGLKGIIASPQRSLQKSEEDGVDMNTGTLIAAM